VPIDTPTLRDAYLRLEGKGIVVLSLFGDASENAVPEPEPEKVTLRQRFMSLCELNKEKLETMPEEEWPPIPNTLEPA
jgi:hypothetical protein